MWWNPCGASSAQRAAANSGICRMPWSSPSATNCASASAARRTSALGPASFPSCTLIAPRFFFRVSVNSAFCARTRGVSKKQVAHASAVARYIFISSPSVGKTLRARLLYARSALRIVEKKGSSSILKETAGERTRQDAALRVALISLLLALFPWNRRGFQLGDRMMHARHPPMSFGLLAHGHAAPVQLCPTTESIVNSYSYQTASPMG